MIFIRLLSVNNTNCDDLRQEFSYEILNWHYLCTFLTSGNSIQLWRNFARSQIWKKTPEPDSIATLIHLKYIVCFLFQSVFKSDLLHLNLTNPLKSDGNMDSYFEHLLQTDSEKCVLDSFPVESCHVVVFSLLLEYLPTSRQRVACCQRAWKLLFVDGLLLIVTPDSRQQHRNVRFTRDWRHTIESIGFARCRYEKLQHLHCMAFRKLETDNGEPGQPELVDSALCIAQDKDSSVNAVTLYDARFHTEQIETTEGATVCCIHSESCLLYTSPSPRD